MKKIIVPLILVMFLSSGCTSPVKEDLFNFVNVDLPSVVEIEERALSQYSDLISKDNYTYEELYQELTTKTIPTYKEFLAALKNIKTSTQEVAKVHSYYVMGAEKQLEAFEKLQQGIKEKDQEKLDSVNPILSESKSYMQQFRDSVMALADDYHLNYKMQ